MDDIDRRILDTLRRDARTPYTEIADDIGVSEGTVRNRVDSLVDAGVIERFTVATSTGNVKAMIEIGVAMDVNTHEIGDRMVEWGEGRLRLAGLRRGRHRTRRRRHGHRRRQPARDEGPRAGGGRLHEDSPHPRREDGVESKRYWFGSTSVRA